jgi:hypothetical protein
VGRNLMQFTGVKEPEAAAVPRQCARAGVPLENVLSSCRHSLVVVEGSTGIPYRSSIATSETNRRLTGQKARSGGQYGF